MAVTSKRKRRLRSETQVTKPREQENRSNVGRRRIARAAIACPSAVRKEMVGVARFELAASCAQGRRANQAALHPDR